MRPSERSEEHLVRLLRRMHEARGSYAALARDLGLPPRNCMVWAVLARGRPISDGLARALGWRRTVPGRRTQAHQPARFVPIDPTPLFDLGEKK